MARVPEHEILLMRPPYTAGKYGNPSVYVSMKYEDFIRHESIIHVSHPRHHV